MELQQRRYGLYAVLHPHQDQYTDIYYEISYFLQLMDQFINKKNLNSSYEEKLTFGTQHIWGNLFHITLIGFVPMMDEHNLEELKKTLKDLSSGGDDERVTTKTSENIKLVWRKSSDKKEPMWDFRITFENERFCSVVNEIHDRMQFYREVEENKKRLRLRNDYHGSLLSDVALSKREEIVDYLAQYQNLIPTIYECMMIEEQATTTLDSLENQSFKNIQDLISEQFRKLTWALQIVSYEDPKQPLNKWQEHEMILL